MILIITNIFKTILDQTYIELGTVHWDLTRYQQAQDGPLTTFTHDIAQLPLLDKTFIFPESLSACCRVSKDSSLMIVLVTLFYPKLEV